MGPLAARSDLKSAAIDDARNKLYDDAYESVKQRHFVSYTPSLVNGRIRFKVQGLYRSPELRDYLVVNLLRFPNVLKAQANLLTGTLLVLFDGDTHIQHSLAADASKASDEQAADHLASYPASSPASFPASDKSVEAIAEALNELLREALLARICGFDLGHQLPNSRSADATSSQRVEAGDAPSSPPYGLASIYKYLRPWHMLPKDEILTFCKSDETLGLTSGRAEARLAKYGRNRITTREEPNHLALLGHQFSNLPSGLLIGSAFFSLFTGGLADAGLIASVVLVNGVIGFMTESRAERAIRSLDSNGQLHCTVIRDAKRQMIAGERLVVGDILVVESGEVPADARLIASDGLRVDESALTGESRPVKKQDLVLGDEHATLSARTNMLYKGTVVTSGWGLAVVVATGFTTELGKIKNLTDTAKTPETVLQQNLRHLGDEMVVASLAVCGGVFVTGLLRGFSVAAMLKSAVSLAIAAVPEGLPTVGTTTLAIGVKRLREQNVLARTLHGVEALGSIQIFCFDKTGTLTRNEMSVEVVYLAHKRLRASELIDEACHSLQADLRQLAHILVLCNDATLPAASQSAEGDPAAGSAGEPANVDANPKKHRTSKGQSASSAPSPTAVGNNEISGSATEKALLQFAVHLGIDPVRLRSDSPRLKATYRTEKRQYMSTRHEPVERQGSGHTTLDQSNAHPDKPLALTEAMKGNPLQVLAQCQAWLVDGACVPLHDADRQALVAANLSLATQALRVLGVAYRSELNGPLIWVGMVGLQDPPRQGIKTLIADFHRAGIKTIMLTGDQMATARAIGEELELSGKGPLRVAPDDWLAKLEQDSSTIAELKKDVHIFPRVSPSSKLKIVRALQNGSQHIVAMTGDGINDAPALKASNVGISLGGVGTAVAKDCADIVVADDDLSTIYYAIMQGRAIRKNLRRSIHFLLATNLSEILVMFGGLSLGLGAPLNPLHLLWINLLTDIFPSLALAMQEPTPELMDCPPEAAEKALFSYEAKGKMAQEAAVMTAGSLGTFAYLLKQGRGASEASTAAFMSLTLAQLLHAISLHAEDAPLWEMPTDRSSRYLGGTVAFGAAMLLGGVYFPPLRRLLGNAPLTRSDSFVSLAGALLPFSLREIDKLLRANKKRDKKKEAAFVL